MSLEDLARDHNVPPAGGNVSDLLRTNNYGVDFVPQVVPIMLGTNNVALLHDSNATIATKMGTLFDLLYSLCPSALYVSMKMFPRNPADSDAPQVTDYNANYHAGAVAAALVRNPGMRLISDDTLSTFTPIVYVDGVHIDVSCGPGLAAALYPKLRGWMGV